MLTVKRRRLLEGVELVPDEVVLPQVPTKAPRVHRLHAPSVANDADPVGSREGSVDAGGLSLPPVTPARRRSDPSRKPMLVQHRVIDLAPEQAGPGNEPVSPNDALGKANAKRLRGALAELDEQLEQAGRAGEAYAALDALLCKLGI